MTQRICLKCGAVKEETLTPYCTKATLSDGNIYHLWADADDVPPMEIKDA